MFRQSVWYVRILKSILLMQLQILTRNNKCSKKAQI